MSTRRALHYFIYAVFIFTATPRLQAQEKPALKPSPAPQTSASPREEQEPVKVFTEEVRLPVFVTDEYGRFDPTLEINELLVLEDGVPQEVRSVRRIPTNVLLLLDTCGWMNPTWKTSTTRDIAKRVIQNLRAGDQVSVIQFSDRPEVIQDWTSERAPVMYALKTKLQPGKRNRLSEAIALAATQLKDRPAGSRHVILVTDGVESPGSKVSYVEATKQLMAAQATVHFINYTAVMTPLTGQQKHDANVSRAMPPDIVMTLPGPLRDAINAPIRKTINVDREMKKLRREYMKASQESQARMSKLAEETGGRVALPTTTEEMVSQTNEVARAIDTQYVVTYRPKRPLAEANVGEYRRIEVAARRVGLHVRSRQGYIVTPTP